MLSIVRTFAAGAALWLAVALLGATAADASSPPNPEDPGSVPYATSTSVPIYLGPDLTAFNDPNRFGMDVGAGVGAVPLISADVYFPTPPGLYPLILMTAGVGDTKADWVNWGKRLASRGFVAVAMNRRINGDVTPNTSGLSAGNFANFANLSWNVDSADILRILKWASDPNAATATGAPSPLRGKVDKARLAISGHSLGGYFATLAAYLSNTNQIDPDTGKKDWPSLKAVLLLDPADLTNSVDPEQPQVPAPDTLQGIASALTSPTAILASEEDEFGGIGVQCNVAYGSGCAIAGNQEWVKLAASTPKLGLKVVCAHHNWPEDPDDDDGTTFGGGSGFRSASLVASCGETAGTASAPTPTPKRYVMFKRYGMAWLEYWLQADCAASRFLGGSAFAADQANRLITTLPNELASEVVDPGSSLTANPNNVTNTRVPGCSSVTTTKPKSRSHRRHPRHHRRHPRHHRRHARHHRRHARHHRHRRPHRRRRAAIASADSAGWIALKPSLLMRDESAGAAVGTDIYVVGGFVGPNTTDQVERYDTAHDRWALVKPMPVARNHPSAVAYGGQLYVLGGYTNGFSNPGVPTGGLAGTSDEFLRYDPKSDSWSSMPWMPVARAAATAAVIGDKLYVAGGRNQLPTYFTSQGLLKRLDIFDFKTGKWTQGPEMPVAREHIAGAVAGGAFYVLGGRLAFDQATGAIATVERYLPAQARWEKVADMRVAHNGFGAAGVGDRIVVYGGEEPSTPELHLESADTEAFDPASGRWTALPPMRTPRGAIVAAAVGRRVYAIQGIDRVPTTIGFGSSIVEALDIPVSPTEGVPGRRPAIRLWLTPRRVHAGARTRFRFRATIEAGKKRIAVGHATIDFAGRRATTDRHGRATIVHRFRSPGVYRAIVRARGSRNGMATVRVLR